MTPKQGSSPYSSNRKGEGSTRLTNRKAARTTATERVKAPPGTLQSKALTTATRKQYKMKPVKAGKSSAEETTCNARDAGNSMNVSNSKDARNHNGRLPATAGTPIISWIF